MTWKQCSNSCKGYSVVLMSFIIVLGGLMVTLSVYTEHKELDLEVRHLNRRVDLIEAIQNLKSGLDELEQRRQIRRDQGGSPDPAIDKGIQELRERLDQKEKDIRKQEENQ